MEKRTDSLPLFDPLREVDPGISLDELQQFLADAPSKEPAMLRYSVAAIAAIAIGLAALIFGSHHSNDRTSPPPRMASISSSEQSPAHSERSEKLEARHPSARSNHLRLHRERIYRAALAETAGIPAAACSSVRETSRNLLPSRDFMNRALLCSTVSVPRSDFGSNTIPSSTSFYEK
ncbi:MAG TPA: hypothetical protein VFH95_02115 [Candidatus Kapabacteria bacterium]|nr:hypothetical protein [Candidatus Kapabacteria bacterium]